MTDPITVGKKIKEVESAYKSYPDFLLGSLYIARFGDPFKKDLVSPISQSNQNLNFNQVNPNTNLASNSFIPLLQKHFPADQVQNALRVLTAESGGNPQAIGDNYPIAGEIRPSYGLFQIRTFPDRPAPKQLLNPETNVAYAAKLFKQSGNSWRPWSVSKKLGLL